jgi:hypothetical protein
MKPVMLEVVTPVLSAMDISCQSCGLILDSVDLRQKYRNGAVKDYPQDWKQAVDELTAWIHKISELYRHRICIRIIDAQSPAGIWKLLRYRLFRYPAFIIDKKHTYTGWNPQELEALIDECMRGAIQQ